MSVMSHVSCAHQVRTAAAARPPAGASHPTWHVGCPPLLPPAPEAVQDSKHRVSASLRRLQVCTFSVLLKLGD
jgi:hypothetical protein